ncbi:sensor domain-containing phosphodiesterase [Nakamurella alba]|uniref:sensor domain-containing phosphodiesterase n=1 Tax=Nakamurella alba TaxID=2665158 RepID=UPI0018AA0CB5|nr:EAL domain-containing protein [Nakamurella alba]
MSSEVMLPAEESALLEDVLASGRISTVFQPIVDLETGSTVGYEALARGPRGPLERPDLLFTAARRAGRVAELDELCRGTAIRSAIEVGVHAPQTLFLNIEPEAADPSTLDEVLELAASAGDLGVVLEITERALAARPARLLATVARLREAGWRIALDDVGADDLSLAFMPILRPDIIKLDMNLVQRRPDATVAAIHTAVDAYAERSGAVVLAEGIETAEHLQMARSLGATLGQGWMYGRPGPSVPTQTGPVDGNVLVPPAPVDEQSRPFASPFDARPTGTSTRRAGRTLLYEISKHLEREAIRAGRTSVVVATFQWPEQFTGATRDRYVDVIREAGFVAAVCPVDEADPVRGQWNVCVLSPHFAGALLARDIDAPSTDPDRLFEFVVTHDRSAVAAAIGAVMTRLDPPAGDPVLVDIDDGTVREVADLPRLKYLR